MSIYDTITNILLNKINSNKWLLQIYNKIKQINKKLKNKKDMSWLQTIVQHTDSIYIWGYALSQINDEALQLRILMSADSNLCGILLNYCQSKKILQKCLVETDDTYLQKSAISQLINLSYIIDNEVLFKITRSIKYKYIWHYLIHYLSPMDIDTYEFMIKNSIISNIHPFFNPDPLFQKIIKKIAPKYKSQVAELIFHKQIISNWTPSMSIAINYIKLTDDIVNTYITYGYNKNKVDNNRIANYITKKDISSIHSTILTIQSSYNPILLSAILNNLNGQTLSTLILITDDPKLINLYRKYL